ncbi:MAG TPA: hypothetical protein VGK47_11055 [Nitrososphaeraceae archaeon]
MKIDKNDAHDRLEHLLEDQSETISRGCDECLKKNPHTISILSRMPYVYIFAFAKTADNGVDKRLLWQPRILKPEAQTNSMLFRAKKNSDIIEICWNIPQKELWSQYQKGNLMQNETVCWSIHQYLNNRKELEAPHPEDLPEERLKAIYDDIIMEQRQKKQMNKLYATLRSEGALTDSPFYKA